MCALNQGHSRLGIQGLSLDLLPCWIQTGNQAKCKHPTQQERVLTLKTITVLFLCPLPFTPSLSSYRRVTHCYVRTKRRSQACPCSQHLEAPWTDMPWAPSRWWERGRGDTVRGHHRVQKVLVSEPAPASPPKETRLVQGRTGRVQPEAGHKPATPENMHEQILVHRARFIFDRAYGNIIQEHCERTEINL